MENNQGRNTGFNIISIIPIVGIILFGLLVGSGISWLEGAFKPKIKDYPYHVTSEEPAFNKIRDCIDGTFATNPVNTVDITETRRSSDDKVLSNNIAFYVFGSEYQGQANCLNTILYTMNNLRKTDVVVNGDSTIMFQFSDSPYKEYRTFYIWYTISTSKLNRDKLGFGDVYDYTSTTGYKK